LAKSHTHKTINDYREEAKEIGCIHLYEERFGEYTKKIKSHRNKEYQKNFVFEEYRNETSV
jgi:hypothetical protein